MPAVYMLRHGTGRSSSDKPEMAILTFIRCVEQRLTVKLLSDRCLF